MDDERDIPSQADELWWAEQNEDWHDDPTTDEEEDFDQKAGESETVSLMERGLWPY
jgi:hypothetical protein